MSAPCKCKAETYYNCGRSAEEHEIIDLKAALASETERANKYRTAWAEAMGELRFEEEHPDGMKAKLAAMTEKFEYFRAGAKVEADAEDETRAQVKAMRDVVEAANRLIREGMYHHHVNGLKDALSRLAESEKVKP